jgi:hypothetical protein
MTDRPTTTKWPPQRGEHYVGEWPPRFKTPAKPAKKPKPRHRGADYVAAMIERHGSLQAWHAARELEASAT